MLLDTQKLGPHTSNQKLKLFDFQNSIFIKTPKLQPYNYFHNRIELFSEFPIKSKSKGTPKK